MYNQYTTLITLRACANRVKQLVLLVCPGQRLKHSGGRDYAESGQFHTGVYEFT